MTRSCWAITWNEQERRQCLPAWGAHGTLNTICALVQTPSLSDRSRAGANDRYVTAPDPLLVSSAGTLSPRDGDVKRAAANHLAQHHARCQQRGQPRGRGLQGWGGQGTRLLRDPPALSPTPVDFFFNFFFFPVDSWRASTCRDVTCTKST